MTTPSQRRAPPPLLSASGTVTDNHPFEDIRSQRDTMGRFCKSSQGARVDIVSIDMPRSDDAPLNPGVSPRAPATKLKCNLSDLDELTPAERRKRRKMELQNGDTVEDLVGKKERPDRKTRIDRERHKMSLIGALSVKRSSAGTRSNPECTSPAVLP